MLHQVYFIFDNNSDAFTTRDQFDSTFIWCLKVYFNVKMYFRIDILAKYTSRWVYEQKGKQAGGSNFFPHVAVVVEDPFGQLVVEVFTPSSGHSISTWGGQMF